MGAHFCFVDGMSEGPEGENLSQTGPTRHNLSLEYKREGKVATIYQQATMSRHWIASFQHPERQEHEADDTYHEQAVLTGSAEIWRGQPSWWPQRSQHSPHSWASPASRRGIAAGTICVHPGRFMARDVRLEKEYLPREGTLCCSSPEL